MKAALKSIQLNNGEDFRSFRPADGSCFSEWLTATIGPSDEEGGERFQLEITTPDHLAGRLEVDGYVWGLHMIITDRYDPDLIVKVIKKRLDHCTGSGWEEVAAKVAQIGAWEFDNYRPSEE